MHKRTCSAAAAASTSHTLSASSAMAPAYSPAMSRSKWGADTRTGSRSARRSRAGAASLREQIVYKLVNVPGIVCGSVCFAVSHALLITAHVSTSSAANHGLQLRATSPLMMRIYVFEHCNQQPTPVSEQRREPRAPAREVGRRDGHALAGRARVCHQGNVEDRGVVAPAGGAGCQNKQRGLSSGRGAAMRAGSTAGSCARGTEGFTPARVSAASRRSPRAEVGAWRALKEREGRRCTRIDGGRRRRRRCCRRHRRSAHAARSAKRAGSPPLPAVPRSRSSAALASG